MKVFVSWSGDRSRQVANALKDWLPMVLQYVEPWVSEKDINAGDRWSQRVAGELEASNFGIICLTPENVSSEWILFEAGALSKSLLDARVVPVLFDLDFKDITGPLAQFQAKKFEKQGIVDIVKAINDASSTQTENALWRRLVDSLWEQLQEKLNSVEAPQKRPVSTDNTQVLEQLVSTVRSFDARLAEIGRGSGQPSGSEPKLLVREIGFVREFGASIGAGGDPYLGLLLYSGLLRTHYPWLSEVLKFIHSGLTSNDKYRFNLAEESLKKISAATNNPELSMKLLEFGSKEERLLISEVAPRLAEYSDIVSLMGFVHHKAASQ